MKAKTNTSPSYGAVSAKFRQHPLSCGLLLDNELAVLLASPPPDPELAALLWGEALVRIWLYDRECTAAICEPVKARQGALLAATLKHLTPLRHDDNSSGLRHLGQPSFTKAEEKIWEFAKRSIANFLDCDGLIAVTSPSNRDDAIAIPFTLSQGGEPNQVTVCDLTNRAIPIWKHESAPLPSCLKDTCHGLRIVLSCDCGPRATDLEGGSFVLAILLAAGRKFGAVGDYPPLSVLCTGALSGNGKLESVTGIEGKRVLARRLGAALFVYPTASAPADDSTLALAPGTQSANCVHDISNHLDDMHLTRIDVHRAYDRIRALQEEIQTGSTALSTASSRLDRYAVVFNAHPTNEKAQEGGLLTLLLRSSIANHQGDPTQAASHYRAAGRMTQRLKNPKLYVHCAAAHVVSLTDMGLINEAEACARKLLKWVSKNMTGAASDRLYAEIEANGVLGGQVLQYKGLQNPAAAKEALKFLNQALSKAEELGSKKDIAIDTAHIALWYALHDPAEASGVIDRAEERLNHLGPDGKRSLCFLHNCRFLAAYRRFLATGMLPAGFSSWPLPEGPKWLLPTALKYRGTLLAASGNLSDAQETFAEASRLFAALPSPLLRFIGATSALQAGESLRVSKSSAWTVYLKQARVEFQSLGKILNGIHQEAAWVKRAEGLLAGKPVTRLPAPQLQYRY